MSKSYSVVSLHALLGEHSGLKSCVGVGISGYESNYVTETAFKHRALALLPPHP